MMSRFGLSRPLWAARDGLGYYVACCLSQPLCYLSKENVDPVDHQQGTLSSLVLVTSPEESIGQLKYVK